ncbi:hypothetical protein A3Q56_01128 [Intoshia linei]|uniref:Serpin domain-containing protein n=1 Tax=Intoshia linei TaxID=1819745 RepID=A0A177BBS6_9BILA|nr:hypothetical protein A3Q56_01128 [Intoshia linei]
MELYDELINRNIRKNPDINIMFSPVMMDVIVFMLHYADGNQDWLQKFDKFKNDKTEYISLSTLKKISAEIADELKFDFNYGNKIYYSNNTKLKKGYLSKMQEIFGLGSELYEIVNFLKKDETMKKVNDFVTECSNNKLDPKKYTYMLFDVVPLMFFNILHYTVRFQNVFNSKNNRIGLFHTSLEQLEQTEFMITSSYLCVDFEKSLVQIPTIVDGLSLLVYQPRNGKKLVMKELFYSLNNMKFEHVTLELPKFFLKSHFNIEESLIDAGINFCGTMANNQLESKTDLYVYNTMHLVNLKVNEYGLNMDQSIHQIMDDNKQIRDFNHIVIDHSFHCFVLFQQTHTNPMVLVYSYIDNPNKT